MEHLLHRAIRGQDDHLLDLGCGEGAWLLRALQAHGGVTAVGVDISGEGFDRVLNEAARLGLEDRLELLRQDVTEYRSTRKADLVLSVGAAYAFGGLLPTLNAAREHLAEDGMLLLGDCFWEREPDAAVRAELEDGPQKYADLPTTVAQVVADGWTPVYGYISTIAEWDEYEWCWTGTLARWALDNPEHPSSDLALQTSAAHRTSWLGGYRGVLGFVVLLLRRTPPPASAEVS
ncbi:SAM-dependent methyltransferase [Lentzea nigeriaca]|uniref:SAM-dependent methyltransferase n=1 Tax=Lentzea nigeriaca TaxID=1128665 RepID=UPI00195A218B|nr:methyltransferase domain-containing protein [Lentzea nigeriaca]MBM7864586.1 SAM-dependent methyltransferase [Lentzea nigeriaca]